MRLVFVISSLFGGGAERQACHLATLFASKGHTVTICTLRGAELETSYPLSEPVRVEKLGVAEESNSFFNARAYAGLPRIRQAVVRHRPQAVITFNDKCSITVLLALLGLHIPVFVRDSHAAWAAPLELPWRILQLLTYPLAASVVVQTMRGAEHFGRIPFVTTTVIANPVQSLHSTKVWGEESQTLVAAGRLEHVKGFDTLLDAFALVAGEFPTWRLRVIGRGPLLAALRERAMALQIAERVDFPGWSSDLTRDFQSAEIFVLSSRVEGFPNALCEAMAFGLPPVALDCPTGPREIIRDGVDGRLVTEMDAPGLAVAMRELMMNRDLRRQFGEKAREVVRRFDAHHITGQWTDLLASFVRKSGGTTP